MEKQKSKCYTLERMDNVCTIILAGGKGERINSETPKVLHKIADKPLIFWTLELLKKLGVFEQIVVTGHKADILEDEIRNANYKVKFARQNEPLGTADAVKTGLKGAEEECNTILVLFGDDSSLYKPETIQDFIDYHQSQNSIMTILTVKKEIPTPLGSLEKDKEGNVVGVLTQRQMIEKGIQENEVACGAFCFERKWLEENLPLVQKSPISGEYPLPGLIKIAAQQSMYTQTYNLPNQNEWVSVNTPEELSNVDQLKREDLVHGNR